MDTFFEQDPAGRIVPALLVQRAAVGNFNPLYGHVRSPAYQDSEVGDVAKLHVADRYVLRPGADDTVVVVEAQECTVVRGYRKQPSQLRPVSVDADALEPGARTQHDDCPSLELRG